MMESGPPTTLNRTEILASHTGMLSTHTSPCMQEGRAHCLLLKTMV